MGANPDAALEKMLQQLGLEPRKGAPLQEHAGQLHQVAGQEACLIVLDNVWSGAQLQALLPPRLAAGGLVLVTTRYADFPETDWWPDWTVRAVVEVVLSLSGAAATSPMADTSPPSSNPPSQLDKYYVLPLGDQAARSLLRSKAGLPKELPQSIAAAEEELIAACAGLPLALVVVGGVLKRRLKTPGCKDQLGAWQVGCC
jgi:hypothetical protein